MKWPDYLENCEGDNNETQQLVKLVEDAWNFVFPNWEWVAESLNKEYNNNRSAFACCAKYKRLAKSGILKPI